MCPDVRKPPRAVTSGGWANRSRPAADGSIPKVLNTYSKVKPSHPSRMEGCWIQGTGASWIDTSARNSATKGCHAGELRLGSNPGYGRFPLRKPARPRAYPAARSLNPAALQAQSDTTGRAPAKRVVVGPIGRSSQHNALPCFGKVSPRLRAGGRSCNAPRALVQKARSKESGIVAARKAKPRLAAETGAHLGGNVLQGAGAVSVDVGGREPGEE